MQMQYFDRKIDLAKELIAAAAIHHIP